MSNRLNQEREKELEPKRIKYAREQIEALGYEITYAGKKRIEFGYKGETIRHWAYSGWHSGSSIKDGRGIKNLIKQLEPKN